MRIQTWKGKRGRAGAKLGMSIVTGCQLRARKWAADQRTDAPMPTLKKIMLLNGYLIHIKSL